MRCTETKPYLSIFGAVKWGCLWNGLTAQASEIAESALPGDKTFQNDSAPGNNGNLHLVVRMDAVEIIHITVSARALGKLSPRRLVAIEAQRGGRGEVYLVDLGGEMRGPLDRFARSEAMERWYSIKFRIQSVRTGDSMPALGTEAFGYQSK
ncbi:uncharacterized protein MELLADRAFT_113080 [Melampsora larici-populina 98AG31]|uniref:Uncharacterized protein n=1 Tax=Melampsora larici-populina (strain 98AG31 / pathotype 3-4-7) TaxID=747676 RepID=F4S8N3_MELLP|nr:uncharacterized protein MELLADRAFT_113080 [Melampsora larici-populina 98AG31]EGF98996.1 hypothetical protein MELLADRAFT_113080 [Melampsora larici-populina 98AG31]